MSRFINVVFDGPPGPVAGRFVEVEDDSGAGIRVGEWVERPNGMWALRIQVEGEQPFGGQQVEGQTTFGGPGTEEEPLVAYGPPDDFGPGHHPRTGQRLEEPRPGHLRTDGGPSLRDYLESKGET